MKPRLPAGHGQTAPSAGSVHPIVSPHWGATQCPPRKKGKIAIAEPLFRRWQLRLSPQDSIFGSFKSISGATDWQMAHFDFTSRSDGMRENSKKVLKSLENTWPNSCPKKNAKEGHKPLATVLLLSLSREEAVWNGGTTPQPAFFQGAIVLEREYFVLNHHSRRTPFAPPKKKTSAGP